VLHALVRRTGTQCSIAGKVGISAPYLSQVLHGRRTPGIGVLVQILDVVGASPSEREAVLSEFGTRAIDRRQPVHSRRDNERGAA
jgi:transcriptional regulator with XRE-family HTH domain